MFKKDAKKAETPKSTTDVSDKEGTKGDPRGDDDTLTTPESDAETVTPPSQKRPYVPSDEIHAQINAADARTKKPNQEFETETLEQVRDRAVKLGVDGNDGLTKDEILAKIAAFQGKRMFDDPAKDEHTPTSAELAQIAKRDGVDKAVEAIDGDVKK